MAGESGEPEAIHLSEGDSSGSSAASEDAGTMVLATLSVGAWDAGGRAGR